MKTLTRLILIALLPCALSAQTFWRGVCLFGMPYAGNDKNLFFGALKNDLHVDRFQVSTNTGAPERNAYFLQPPYGLKVIAEEAYVLSPYSSFGSKSREYRDLANGKHNSRIRNAALQMQKYPAVIRHYLRDEPGESMFAAWRKVRDALPPTVGAVAFIDLTGSAIERFATQCAPSEILIDPYCVQNNTPAPYFNRAGDSLLCDSNGIERWSYDWHRYMSQVNYDAVLIHRYRPAAEASKKTGRALIVGPQLHGYFKKATRRYDFDRDLSRTPCLRPPSASEIRVQFNLSLAYGAKGFLAYPYATYVGPLGATGRDSVAFPGLHAYRVKPYIQHQNNWDTFYGKRVWTGYAEKWAAVAEFYDRLSRNAGFLENKLLSLKWLGAKSWTTMPWEAAHPDCPRTTAQTNGWSGIILEAYAPSLSPERAPGDTNLTYVEIGHLRGGTTDYLYVVNRRTAPQDTIDISLRVSASANWTVTDVETGRTWNVDGGRWWKDTFRPGDGKLYSLARR